MQSVHAPRSVGADAWKPLVSGTVSRSWFVVNTVNSPTRLSGARKRRISIFDNFTALSLAQIVASVARFAYLIAIARFLEPGALGVFTYGMAFSLALMGIAGLGQRTTLSTRIGKRPKSADRTVSYSLTATLATLSAVASCAIVLQWAFGDRGEVSVAVTFFLLTVVARGIAIWVRSCGMALEDTKWILRYEAIFRLAEVAIGIAALTAGAGLISICAIHLVVWTTEAVAGLCLLKRRSGLTLALGSDFRLLKAVIVHSLPFAVTLWLTVLTTQVGVVALKFLQPDTATVGHFAIAMQVTSVLLIGPLALGQALLPGLARAYRSNSAADLSLFLTLIKLVIVGGTVIALLTATGGPILLTFLLGSDYAAAGEAFSVAIWTLAPLSAVILMVEGLNAFGQRHNATLLVGTVVVLHVALMALLIELWPPLAAATVSFVAASLVGAVLGSVLVARCFKSSQILWLSVPALLSALAAAAMQLDPLPGMWAGPLISAVLSIVVLMSGAVPLSHLRTLLRRATVA